MVRKQLIWVTNSKNKWMYGILILSVFALITSVSYALWQMTLQQTTTNVITTGCFKIEFQDNNPIQMEKSYPISDEEAKELTPYTFTITNTCESYATYQINLELLDTTTLENLDYINVRLNEKRKQSIGSLEEVTTTIQNAKSARKLEIGYLNHLESKTFTMQMWMDENTPANEEVMNKVLESKITVNTSVLTKSPTYAEVITNCSNNGYKTVDCMLENSTYEKEDLMLDETIDNNLRYIGSNPNNYVTFNNELWQIIGVMNNVEDENGKKDSRIKLIRTEAIGIYSWDSSASNVNGGMGVNEWSQADLMKLLNPGYESESVGGSLYWNRENGTCYKGKNNAITTCNFSSMGINENSKQFIDNVIWNTGTSGSANYQKLNAKELFAYEKSSNIGKICTSSKPCNDTVSRTTKWLGKVGLISLSDYGFAAPNKECYNACLFHSSYPQNCKINNWLTENDYNYWSISPVVDPGSVNIGTNTAYIMSNGGVCGYHAMGWLDLIQSVRPSIFLNSNVKIISGDGTRENSYKLELIGE